MEIGILGLKQSGKSTLFEIMTGVKSREIFGEPSVRGVAKVPDARFDNLVSIFKPAKVSPASVPFVDTNATGENPWDSLRKSLGAVDGLLHIVDAHSAKDVSEVVARYRKLVDELVISDLLVVENRLTRLTKLPKTALKGDEVVQAEVFPKCKEVLETGKPLRELKLNPQEDHALRGFGFWTLRPELVVLNTKEGGLTQNVISASPVIPAHAGIQQFSSPVIEICCQMEAEIAELAPEDRKAFLESAGIKEPAFELIIRTAFSLLGRVCYFTVGEDEVKAWVIPSNSTAPRAAAAIHKDFERGFIKAEVVSYKDFIECGGTLAGAKSNGKLRLEGKEYIVEDGDIISFRFNV